MPFDVHGALLVAVVAGVTALIRFLPFVVFGGGRPTPKFVVYLAGVLPAPSWRCSSLLPARRGPARPHPRPAGAACRGRRGGAAPVEEEHAAQHCRGHRPVYGAGAGGVCVTRKKCASPKPLGPLCEGAPPQAVGERTLWQSETFRVVARFSPSAPSGHLPRRGRQESGVTPPPHTPENTTPESPATFCRPPPLPLRRTGSGRRRGRSRGW